MFHEITCLDPCRGEIAWPGPDTAAALDDDLRGFDQAFVALVPARKLARYSVVGPVALAPQTYPPCLVKVGSVH
jgi:hypothetical protein